MRSGADIVDGMGILERRSGPHYDQAGPEVSSLWQWLMIQDYTWACPTAITSSCTLRFTIFVQTLVATKLAEVLAQHYRELSCIAVFTSTCPSDARP